MPLASCAQNLIFVDGFERLPPLSVTCPISLGSSRDAVLASADPSGPALTEVSGLALSRTQRAFGAPVLWVHNDSGGGARFSAYSLGTGARLKSYRLSGALIDASDWEDLALGPCGDAPGDCLYIGNFGNNAAREVAPIGTQGRQVLHIYKLPEPDLSSTVDNQALSAGVQVLRFSYGAGSPTLTADAETLLVDPTGDLSGGVAGDLYIVTKWNGAQAGFRRLFKFPLSLQGSATAALPALGGSFIGATQTRGDVSWGGELIVLGDYLNARIYRRSRSQTIGQALAASPCLTLGLPTGASEFQFEATGFDPDGGELIEISECSSAPKCNPPIHRTRLQR